MKGEGEGREVTMVEKDGEHGHIDGFVLKPHTGFVRSHKKAIKVINNDNYFMPIKAIKMDIFLPKP